MKKYYRPLNECFIQKKIAHRGLHSETVIENSLLAFARAIEGGFAIEIDVQLLADGELAVVHDSNLHRVTGIDKAVGELSSADLENYPLLLNGGKIPTLKETLAFINGRAPLLIELKFDGGFNKRLVDGLLEQLKDYPHKDKIALQSFHPLAVKYLKKRSLEYSVGFLATYKIDRGAFVQYLCKSLAMFGHIRADFMSYDIDYLPNKYVSKRQKKGFQLLTWTINTEEKLQKALQFADNIIFEDIQV